MQRKKITWNELAEGFEGDAHGAADKQWCLEEAIDIVKQRASSNVDTDLVVLLEMLYEKIKELGEDAWIDRENTTSGSEL